MKFRDKPFWALQYAHMMASASEFVMVLRGRPEISRRAAWSIQFDRSLTQATRLQELERLQSARQGETS